MAAYMFQEALLSCTNGLFHVSVPADVAERIDTPREVFQEGSFIIAIENAPPAGSVVMLHPEEIAERGGGNGHKPMPAEEGPQSGLFRVRFHGDEIELVGPMPPGMMTDMTG